MKEPNEAARKLAKAIWDQALDPGPLFVRQESAESLAAQALDGEWNAALDVAKRDLLELTCGACDELVEGVIGGLKRGGAR